MHLSMISSVMRSVPLRIASVAAAARRVFSSPIVPSERVRSFAVRRLSGVNYKIALATIRIPDDNYIDFSAAAGGAPVVSSLAD